jgi:hypothetical protein
MAAFSPDAGRRAPEYIIPTQTTGLQLWVQQEGAADYTPAPAAGSNAFDCQISTDFQADLLA